MWGYVVASGSKYETNDGKWGQVRLSETKRMLVVVCRGMWWLEKESGGGSESKWGCLGEKNSNIW